VRKRDGRPALRYWVGTLIVADAIMAASMPAITTIATIVITRRAPRAPGIVGPSYR